MFRQVHTVPVQADPNMSKQVVWNFTTGLSARGNGLLVWWCGAQAVGHRTMKVNVNGCEKGSV
jgi:hypothetical protein